MRALGSPQFTGKRVRWDEDGNWGRDKGQVCYGERLRLTASKSGGVKQNSQSSVGSAAKNEKKKNARALGKAVNANKKETQGKVQKKGCLRKDKNGGEGN